VTKKKVSFEEAVKRLEEIVSRLEDGSVSLEESMGAFEEGKNLVKMCLEKLDAAEKKISKLQKNEQGELKLTDFES